MSSELEWSLTDIHISCDDKEVITCLDEIIWDKEKNNYTFSRVFADEISDELKQTPYDEIADHWADTLIFYYHDNIAAIDDDYPYINVADIKTITFAQLFDWVKISQSTENTVLDVEAFLMQQIQDHDPDLPVFKSIDPRLVELITMYIDNFNNYQNYTEYEFLYTLLVFTPLAVYPKYEVTDNTIIGEYYVHDSITASFYTSVFEYLLQSFSKEHLEKNNFSMKLYFIDVKSRSVYHFENGFLHDFDIKSLKKIEQ